MLRTFIFNESKNEWIEENDHLFYHDLCAILDENSKIIYLWRGPKSTKEYYKKGYKSLNKLISESLQQKFQINVLAKYIPNHIEEKLNKMLILAKRQKEIGKYKFSKFTTIRLYLIFLVLSIIIPIISGLILSTCLFWPVLNGNFIVSDEIYQDWLYYQKISILISLVIFMFNIIIGLYERESQIITFSLMGLIICIGILLYLQQGIFLFKFQAGSTSSLYLIAIQEIIIFWIIIISAIGIFELPNLLKLVSFIRTYRNYIF